MDTKTVIDCYITSHIDSLDECEKLAKATRLTLNGAFESELNDSYRRLQFTGTIGDVCRFFYKLGNRKLYVFPS